MMVHHGPKDESSWTWLVACPQCRKEPVRPGMICEDCRARNASAVEINDMDREADVGFPLEAA